MCARIFAAFLPIIGIDCEHRNIGHLGWDRVRRVDPDPDATSRVAKKLKLQERRAVIPSRRSLVAGRPLGFLGRLRAPSRIGGHTRGTYGVGTYPCLHHWDRGPGAAAAERVSGC